ncbi:MAG: amidohydrolase [Firmicutes bacterium]|nr:amidohydrolase [Bacillota bacterium]
MYSLLIRGGLIVDGTGRPPYPGDVAVENGIIVAIDAEISDLAVQTIDATGLIISPGFIDIHSHADASIFRNPLSESKVLQGVTTEIVGNCGIGLFPVDTKRVDMLIQYLLLHETSLPPEGITWCDFNQYTDIIESNGLGVNFAPLVAHGTLRIAAMGMEARQPEPIELAAMKAMLDSALEQGAWGLSSGLIYPPGSFAASSELTCLAGVVARYGSIFAAHIRNEGNNLLEAIREIIAIGQASNARVQISHLKAIGKANWGRGKTALELLAEARRQGVDVAADMYPYEASSTSLTAIVPQWAMEGGSDALLRRLAERDDREEISTGISREMSLRGGPASIMITAVGMPGGKAFSGKTIADLAMEWRCGAEDAVIKLLIMAEAVVSAVFFSLFPEEVSVIAVDKAVAVGSDGFGMNALRDGSVATHPRSYGTFPKFLAKYVRTDKLLNWEEAVYKMTGLPAARLGFKRRGILKSGNFADITVFDPLRVNDKAGYIECHNYSEGIEWVFVNGQAVVKSGRITGNMPGKVLRRQS